MLERVWRKGNPLTLLVGMQTSTATMENSVEIPLKLEIELPYHPAIPFLGIHTKETIMERDTCTPVFIAALFIIARTCKQPRWPFLLNKTNRISFASIKSPKKPKPPLEPVLPTFAAEMSGDVSTVIGLVAPEGGAPAGIAGSNE